MSHFRPTAARTAYGHNPCWAARPIRNRRPKDCRGEPDFIPDPDSPPYGNHGGTSPAKASGRRQGVRFYSAEVKAEAIVKGTCGSSLLCRKQNTHHVRPPAHSASRMPRPNPPCYDPRNELDGRFTKNAL